MIMENDIEGRKKKIIKIKVKSEKTKQNDGKMAMACFSFHRYHKYTIKSWKMYKIQQSYTTLK